MVNNKSVLKFIKRGTFLFLPIIYIFINSCGKSTKNIIPDGGGGDVKVANYLTVVLPSSNCQDTQTNFCVAEEVQQQQFQVQLQPNEGSVVLTGFHVEISGDQNSGWSIDDASSCSEQSTLSSSQPCIVSLGYKPIQNSIDQGQIVVSYNYVDSLNQTVQAQTKTMTYKKISLKSISSDYAFVFSDYIQNAIVNPLKKIFLLSKVNSKLSYYNQADGIITPESSQLVNLLGFNIGKSNLFTFGKTGENYTFYRASLNADNFQLVSVAQKSNMIPDKLVADNTTENGEIYFIGRSSVFGSAQNLCEFSQASNSLINCNTVLDPSYQDNFYKIISSNGFAYVYGKNFNTKQNRFTTFKNNDGSISKVSSLDWPNSQQTILSTAFNTVNNSLYVTTQDTSKQYHLFVLPASDSGLGEAIEVPDFFKKDSTQFSLSNLFVTKLGSVFAIASDGTLFANTKEQKLMSPFLSGGFNLNIEMPLAANSLSMVSYDPQSQIVQIPVLSESTNSTKYISVTTAW